MRGSNNGHINQKERSLKTLLFFILSSDALSGSNIQMVITTTNVDVQDYGYIIGAQPLSCTRPTTSSQTEGKMYPLVIVRYFTQEDGTVTYHTQFKCLTSAYTDTIFSNSNYSIRVYYLSIQSN